MNLDNYAFTRDEFERRLYSIFWHGGIMIAVALLDLFGQSLELFNMPTWLVGILVVVIPQITKWLRNYYDEEAIISYVKEKREKLDAEIAEMFAEEEKTAKKSTRKPAKKTKKGGKK